MLVYVNYLLHACLAQYRILSIPPWVTAICHLGDCIAKLAKLEQHYLKDGLQIRGQVRTRAEEIS